MSHLTQKYRYCPPHPPRARPHTHTHARTSTQQKQKGPQVRHTIKPKRKLVHTSQESAILFRLLAVKVYPIFFLFHFVVKNESMVLLLSQNPPTLAPADALGRYTCISSHQLHRMNEPGILSMHIHPSKVSLILGLILNIFFSLRLTSQIAHCCY